MINVSEAPGLESPTRVLLVEDDGEIRHLLWRYLETNGIKMSVAADAGAARRLMTRQFFDLVILDLSLPDEDGLGICKSMRDAGDSTPLVMLTARSDLAARVTGLEMGADDYVTKPFEPSELLARIHAQVRGRLYKNMIRGDAHDPLTVTFGIWRLSLDRPMLCREGHPVDITPTEYALLKALATHCNTPLGRDKLIRLTHSFGATLNWRSVDVQIMRLRRLIESDPACPQLIQTVWGVGYVFAPGESGA
ncbi:MAG: response regulator [Pseudomonadota bacterium]